MIHNIKQLLLLVLLGASYVLAQNAGDRRSNGDTPEQSYPHCSSQKFGYGERAKSKPTATVLLPFIVLFGRKYLL
jgi:hypothetical protein